MGEALVTAADAALQYEAGAWDAALAGVASLKEFLPPYGVAPAAWLPWQAYGLAALIAAHRGQDATADALLAQVPDRLEPTDDAIRSRAGFALAARAVRAEQSGRTDVALGLLASALAADIGQKQSWLPQLARLALDAGRRDLLETAVQSAEAAASDSAADKALARHMRGLAQGHAELLAAAARYYKSASRRLDLGRVEEDLAALTAAAGDPVNARRHLVRAVEAYVMLGAKAEMLRADARLLRSGVRRSRRATAPDRPGRRGMKP